MRKGLDPVLDRLDRAGSRGHNLGTVLLSRLFENLELRVEPFATCAVATGWRLRLPPQGWVTVHFVLQEEGELRDARGRVHHLGTHTLALVPQDSLHSIECGTDVVQEAGARADAEIVGGVAVQSAGPPGSAGLRVACGRLQATYGGGVGLFDRLTEVLVLDFSGSSEMRAVFEGLLREQETPAPGSRAMMAALMNQCLVLMFRHLCTHPNCELPWLAALEDPQLADVMDEILASPERPHTVESLAQRANMSRAAFARRFRDSFGRSPIRYLRDVRLRRAARLLRGTEDLSIDAVAHRVGFGSRSHFSHAFRDLFGVSPTDFRVGGQSPGNR